MEELISVIVPVYNIGAYVERCVKSICSQTYKKLEIILVDDGSSDNSSVLCDEIAKKDSRIIVIHKKNGGLSEARNTGIERAAGKYLVFVDGDDYISRFMIEKLYHAIRLCDAELSICNFEYVYENTSTITHENTDLPLVNNVLKGEDILFTELFKYKSWYWVVAWNKIYKKELFNELRFPVGKIHEDEYIVHRLLAKCQKVATISEPLYYYVQRNAGIMYNCRKKKIDIDKVGYLLDRVIFYKENGYPSECVWKLIRSILTNIYDIFELKNTIQNSEFSIIKKNLQIQFSYVFNECQPIDHSVSRKEMLLLKLANYDIAFSYNLLRFIKRVKVYYGKSKCNCSDL